MTRITEAQEALLQRIIVAAADPTIKVVAYFEGMPNGYEVRKPIRTNGVLEFQADLHVGARIREDMLIGILEEVI